ncbi:homeobox protein VENTX [Trichechus manatus latirostris]|uniref:Homeobox protein VENTX n=1 Tax=Trichechus manatus latirostris TaxID=127582 RepID=A0A2Y9DI52_TRIMA|nr:homeobox protein VENTX [Trichechus manatus latirostris]
MPPSSDLPRGHKPNSSFFSVDWLAQSSHLGPTHTSRPSEVFWRGLSAPAWAPSRGEPSQNVAIDGAKTPNLHVQGALVAATASSQFPAVSSAGLLPTGTPVTCHRHSTPPCTQRAARLCVLLVTRRGSGVFVGLSKEPDPSRAPRVRTAFTTAQISTLESAFKLRQYLGPQERKKLAKEMQLTEVQIKTWFQNRRMKHKRQMQDSQLSVPFSRPLYTPLAIYPPSPVLGSSLQLLCPGAHLPSPPALVLPPGSFWDPCPVEQVALASAWDPCHGQPLIRYLPEPGGPGACVLCPKPGMPFEGVGPKGPPERPPLYRDGQTGVGAFLQKIQTC